MVITTFDSTLPDASVAVSANSDFVLRRGKIFEIGDYADKKFSLSADEAQLAVAAFSPCAVNLEHKKTILDGHLGSLVDVSLSADGKTLFGSVMEPSWLAGLLPTSERKVSLEWDQATKQIVGVAHVLNPRIKDAVVFDAFARFSSGEEVVPFAYESTAERDAILEEDFGDPTNKLFPVRTQEECRQSLNELAFADDPTAVKVRIVAIAARKGLKIPDNYWMQTRGVSKPIVTNSDYSMYSQEKNMTPVEITEVPKVSFMDQVKALFSGAKPEELAEVEGALTHAKTGKTPREIELETKLAKFEADESVKFSQAANEKAIAFADGLVEAKKIAAKGNTQYEAAVALFSIASEFDAKKPALVCFNDEFPADKFQAAESVKALFAAIPAHTKEEEQAGGLEAGAVAMFEQAVTTVKDASGNEVDYAEVNRARRENGMPEIAKTGA